MDIKMHLSIKIKLMNYLNHSTEPRLAAPVRVAMVGAYQ